MSGPPPAEGCVGIAPQTKLGRIAKCTGIPGWWDQLPMFHGAGNSSKHWDMIPWTNGIYRGIYIYVCVCLFCGKILGFWDFCRDQFLLGLNQQGSPHDIQLNNPYFSTISMYNIYISWLQNTYDHHKPLLLYYQTTSGKLSKMNTHHNSYYQLSTFILASICFFGYN